MYYLFAFLLCFVSVFSAFGQQEVVLALERAKTCSLVPEDIITHTGYTVSYNYRWKEPNWVAWELTSDETYGLVKRQSQFLPDPDVDPFETAYSTDYSRSGYDRGHMAPAGDMKWSPEAMTESFYLSNICPQDKSINAGQWQDLEQRCRSWAKQYQKVWICCGPIVDADYQTIGANQIAVPSGFFKVVCLIKKNNYQAIGFLFPNEPSDKKFWDFAVSVDVVEEIVGHDFFFSLPDAIENKIEANDDLKIWKQ